MGSSKIIGNPPATLISRSTDEDFRLRFEALKDFTPAERSVAGELLDSLILKHTANRLSAKAQPAASR